MLISQNAWADEDIAKQEGELIILADASNFEPPPNTVDLRLQQENNLDEARNATRAVGAIGGIYGGYLQQGADNILDTVEELEIDAPNIEGVTDPDEILNIYADKYDRRIRASR